MAIVQNPITGRTRKKFGTAVFSKHYEQNTMRTRPMQVSNPRTEGQVKQRSKFAQTVDLIRQVLPVVNDAYSNTLKNMSPFNKIVSINSKNIFVEGTNEIDYTKVQFCDNEGSNVRNVELTCEDDQVVSFIWEPNTINQAELDELKDDLEYQKQRLQWLVRRTPDKDALSYGVCFLPLLPRQ